METLRYERVRDNPKFKELVTARTRFATTLTIIMLAIYFGFILLVAFAPGLLGTRLGDGVTTLGIPLGLLVILSAFVLTGIYVRRANSEFDRLNDEIIEESGR
ncbi:DUF485 domain-containing protein [Geminicoccaceae bacterium 1502E]|nr:DUF485 domain-containing protein [Geminicoccaceae bacterium 1502E]